jgi:hypothetical protein
MGIGMVCLVANDSAAICAVIPFDLVILGDAFTQMTSQVHGAIRLFV